ncbi:MAG: OmpL47-type beta-barrel domain-containing protein [Candidatus Nanohalobium sp.]
MKKKILIGLIAGLLMVSSGAAASWHNNAQQVTLNAQDQGSGVKNTYYCVDQSNSCSPRSDGQKYTGPFSVTKEGINYVRYNSKDNVGNVEDTRVKKIKIDYTEPNSADDYPGGWQKSPTTVTLSCNDPDNPSASGCSKTQYCVGSGCTPSTTGKSISFDTEGKHYLNYRSTDVAGNTESTKTRVVKLDFTKPEILVNKKGSSSSGSMTASVTCSDQMSGCDTGSLSIYKSESPIIQCPEDSSKYKQDPPFEVKQHLWICASGKDNAGNFDSSGNPLEFSVGTLTATLRYPGKPGLVYTSVDSKIPITVELRNEKDMTRTINVSAKGVPVTFENDKPYEAVTLNGVEDRSLSGVVQVDKSGNHTAKFTITDETEGFTMTRTADIYAKEKGARTSSSGKQVPGPGLLQITVMLLVASGYFILRP